MQKIKLLTMVMLLSLTSIQATTTTIRPITPIEISNPKEISAEVKILLDRLDEIKSMDRSTLNSKEKKELRKELRSIKSSLARSGNGVYLSVGAIIIIILLLILIL